MICGLGLTESLKTGGIRILFDFYRCLFDSKFIVEESLCFSEDLSALEFYFPFEFSHVGSEHVKLYFSRSESSFVQSRLAIAFHLNSNLREPSLFLPSNLFSTHLMFFTTPLSL